MRRRKNWLLYKKKLDLSKAAEEVGEDGDLDAFMLSMNNRLDNAAKTKLKRHLIELKKEVEKLRKLVEKTRPTSLPKLIMTKNPAGQKTSHIKENESPSVSYTMTHKNKDRPAVDNTTKHTDSQKMEKDNTVNKTDKKTSINLVNSMVQSISDITEDKNMPPPVKKPKKTNKTKSSTSKTDEKDFVEWLPPDNQTGDGRTSLNDKLGY